MSSPVGDLGEALSRKIGPLPVGAWVVVVAAGLWLGLRRGGNDASDGEAGQPAVDEPGSWTGGNPGGGVIGLPNNGEPVSPITPIVGGPVPAPVRPATPVVTPVRTVTPLPTVTRSPLPVLRTTAPTPIPAPSYYVVKSGDTLSGIAARYRKTVTWLYTTNRTVIEAAARQHGRTSSMSGRYIYPGTRLRVS